MTLLKLKRYEFETEWTLGKLLINNIPDGYTVEDEIRTDKKYCETAIPTGIYQLSTRYSPKFSDRFYWSDKHSKLIDATTYNNLKLLKQSTGFSILHNVNDYQPHNLIWLKDVPEFEYVLIHWGNTDLDSCGCLIIGDSIGLLNGRDAVLNSRKYYIKFYEKVYPLINKNKEFIEII